MLVDRHDQAPHWFLVRTKRRQERKAAQALEARAVPAYCPLVLEPRLSPFAPRGPVPLFPAYVFAHLSLGERFAAAHYCPGSCGLVRMGERFAAVDDEVVTDLKVREADRGYIVLDSLPQQLREGARVRVARGVLAGLQGVVTRYVPARRRVRILLKWACGGHTVEVDAASVRCG